ncbi:MAG: hypothetical protein ACLU9X_03265 [Alistipes shahii]|uniref:hypothetical protein n=1 Tax=Alistipes shahii TaxID=328814 RepID=UPI003A230E93
MNHQITIFSIGNLFYRKIKSIFASLLIENNKKQDEKTAHNRFRAAGLRRRKPGTDKQQKRKEYENDRIDQSRLSEEGRRL